MEIDKFAFLPLKYLNYKKKTKKIFWFFLAEEKGFV